MELKLNIYKSQREIEKTYTTESYDVLYGTVEDLMGILDLDALAGKQGSSSMMEAVGKLLTANRAVFNPLLKDIFPGVTDDELRRVKVKELLEVVANLAGFSVSEIMSLYDSGKKVLEGQRMR